MRLVLVFVGVVAALAAWLSLDANSTARQRLADFWHQTTVLFGADPEPPRGANWGDVAAKIGEFATEERGLRQILNGDGAAQPAGATAAPEPGSQPAAAESPAEAAEAAEPSPAR